MSYPNGDVPIKTGVCSDVVVRAFRAGLGLDLQELVHEDMKKNFHLYPNNWGLRSTDRNIDHRRVLNLRTFFERKGWAIRASENPADYKPGDILTCIVPPNLPHIMIVSDRKTLLGRPYVLHNIGQGVKEEDRLFDFQHTGHFRIGQFKHSACE